MYLSGKEDLKGILIDLEIELGNGYEIPTSQMQHDAADKKTIQASYTLEGAVLENVDNIKYLGVTITNDLKWNTHISNICTKANRSLGFLRRTLFSSPQNVKEAAYKGMVRPILEYGSSVWDPHTDIKLQEELEKVQERDLHFDCSSSGSLLIYYQNLELDILRFPKY